MVNRRSFAKQIVGYLPVYAMAAGIAEAQQGARQVAVQYPPGRGPFDGSPVGSRLPDQKWLVHDHSRPQPRKVTPAFRFQRPRRRPMPSCCSMGRIYRSGTPSVSAEGVGAVVRNPDSSRSNRRPPNPSGRSWTATRRCAAAS